MRGRGPCLARGMHGGIICVGPGEKERVDALRRLDVCEDAVFQQIDVEESSENNGPHTTPTLRLFGVTKVRVSRRAPPRPR